MDQAPSKCQIVCDSERKTPKKKSWNVPPTGMLHKTTNKHSTEMPHRRKDSSGLRCSRKRQQCGRSKGKGAVGSEMQCPRWLAAFTLHDTENHRRVPGGEGLVN